MGRGKLLGAGPDVRTWLSQGHPGRNFWSGKCVTRNMDARTSRDSRFKSAVVRNGMIKASVIVPTFNRGYILGEAIQSILDQTYPLFEVIIVDDGSTDDTVEVVNRFKDGRVRLIQHSMNSGVAAARNSGLKAAQGDLISFLDSDDLWSPDKLALEVKFLAGHPEVDGVFTDLRVEGADAV